MLTNKKLIRRFSFIILVMTFHYFSGIYQLVQAAKDLMEDPVYEQSAYEVSDLNGSKVDDLVQVELGKSPVKIFDWVRSQIAYDPYCGSLQGAKGTYIRRAGNDFDQAVLLGAMLENAGIKWQLVQGDLRLPIESAKKWLRIDTPNTIYRYLTKAGVECKLHPTPNKPEYLLLKDHMWVQAKSHYFPMAGGALDDTQADNTTPPDPADLWVDLDPSITYYEKNETVDLEQLTGISSDDIKSLVGGSTTGNTLSGMTLPRAKKQAEEASGRLEQLLYHMNTSVEDYMINTTTTLEMKSRETLPGNMVGDILNFPTIINPENTEAFVNFLLENRYRLNISLTDGTFYHEWDWIGLPKFADKALTLHFQKDASTTIDDSVNTLALSSTKKVNPVLTLGSQAVPGVSTNAPDYVYGSRLELTVTLSDPTGKFVMEKEVPITAGGVYGFSFGDYLTRESSRDFYDSLTSNSLHELLPKTLRLSAQSSLHQQNSIQHAALVAHDYTVVRPLPLGVMSGFEPPINGTNATGVRFVSWPVGDRGVPLSRKADNLVPTDSLAQLSGLIEDVALTAPMEILGGHDGYQSAGRILSLYAAADESSQDYYITKTTNSITSPVTSSDLTDFLAKYQRQGTTITSENVLFDVTDDPVLPYDNRGHGVVVHGEELMALAAFPAEDTSSPMRRSWTPIISTVNTDPVVDTLINPGQLVTCFSQVVSNETLLNRSKILSQSSVGITEAMMPAMATTSLITVPWITEDLNGNWDQAIPATCAILFEQAANFIRPKVLDFKLGTDLINTVQTTDSVLNVSNDPDALPFSIVMSRSVEDITASFNANEVTSPPSVSLTSGQNQEFYSAFSATSLSGITADGVYQVRAQGTATGNVASEIEIRTVEVDNTAPQLSLSVKNPETATSLSGTIDIIASASDKNFSNWALYCNTGSGWTAMPEYTGTYQMPGAGSLVARIDTFKMGWNDNVTPIQFALVANDLTGNRSATTTSVTIENDLTDPVITLTASHTDGTVSINSNDSISRSYNDAEATLRIVEDNLAQVKLWIENDRDPSTKIVLHDSEKSGLLDAYTVPVTNNSFPFETAALQGMTPDDTWSIRAEAIDTAGNSDTAAIENLSFADLIWSFEVDPPSLFNHGRDKTYFIGKTTSPPDTWEYNVYIMSIWSQTAYGDPVYTFNYTPASGEETSYYFHEWDGRGNDGLMVDARAYIVELTVTKDAIPETATDQLNVVTGDFDPTESGPRILYVMDDQPGIENDLKMDLASDGPVAGEISSDFIITQGQSNKINIVGSVGTFAGNYFPLYLRTGIEDTGFRNTNGPLPPFNAGYDQAFWAVEFKPSSSPPPMDNILNGVNSGYNLTNRDHWQLISWGTERPMLTSLVGWSWGYGGLNYFDLAEWDASKLPLGYYDLRLWVTDGSNMAHHVLGGLKVVSPYAGNGTDGGIADIGALTLSSTDLTVPFSGFNAEISRDYNSRNVYQDGPLGYGWKLRGINLKVDTFDQRGREEDEAFITLPDGREFWFANSPPIENASIEVNNPWVKYGEYLQRPYGMKLYRPGGSTAFYDGLVNTGDLQTEMGFPKEVEDQYTDPSGVFHRRGDVAYLQIEDKTWYVFQWKTGEIYEIIKPDGRVLTFDHGSTGATSSDQVSSEILISDEAGRTLILERDPSTKHVLRALDPNGFAIEYEYDENNNLTTVRDRRGFERYYIYDTFENEQYFAEHFPGDGIEFTGMNPHRLVDVRIDDDTNSASRFAADTVPAYEELSDPATAAGILLSNQNWPGDTSIMKFKYEGDDIAAYETRGGNVDLDYNREESGAGSVSVAQRESGSTSEVVYNDQGKVETVTDIYGAPTTYVYPEEGYGFDTTGDGEKDYFIKGIMTSETDALGNQTTYDYQEPEKQDYDSFADMFKTMLDRKMACGGTLYIDDPDCGNYIDPETPGYLTGAQMQPAGITQVGNGSDAGTDIATSIEYMMEEDSKFAFQPESVEDPLGNITNLGYSAGLGKMTSISRGTGDDEKTLSTTVYIEGLTTSDSIYTGHPGYLNTPFEGEILSVTSHDKDGNPENTTEYGYLLGPDAGATVTYSESGRDLSLPKYFEEHAVRSEDQNGNVNISFSRLDAQGRTVESFSSSYTEQEAVSITKPSVNVSSKEVTYDTKENQSFTWYDAEGNVVRTEDAEGNKTYRDYDWMGRLVVSTSVPAPDEKNKSGEYKTISRYFYDDMGRQYKNETVSVGFDGNERVISNSETAYKTIPETPAEDQAITGRIEEVKDRRGFVSESRYDTGGRLVGSRRFDPKGNLLDETSYEYDALGRQEKVWSLGDGLTTTTYDCFGRTATTSRHAEDLDNLIRTHYAYDIGGRQTASKVTIGDLNDTTGVWTVNSYDDAKDGRLDAVYLYQADPAAPTGTKLSYLYDGDGRRVGEKDAADHWTYTHYDEAGQVAATILNWQAGATPTALTDLSGIPLYNDLDEDIQVQSAADLRFDFAYDSETGRQTEILKPGSLTDPATVPTGYGMIEKLYDADGRLEYEFGQANSSDPQNTGVGIGKRQVKEFVYNDDGRLTTEKYGVADADRTNHLFDNQRVTYTYHSQWGSVQEKAFYTGNGTLERREYYQYDNEWGDLKSVITENDIGDIIRRESFHYDEVTGRMVAKISPEGTLWYSYNERGRLSEIKSSTGLRTVYAYDEYGRVKSVTDPGMSANGDQDKSVTYSYDALGRKDIVTYPNGATVDYDYEDTRGGWVQKITHKDGGDALILSLTYTRDDDGTITEIVEDRGEANTEYKWVYTYDGLKRLTDASFTTFVSSSQTAQTVYQYTYDRRGNRLTKTVDNNTTYFVYNDLDQLVSETTGANSKTYTWDKFGRLASEADGSDSRAYTWSVDDRMLSVEMVDNDNTLAVNYTYNHQGDRVGQGAQGNNGSGTPVDVDKLFLADRKNLTGYSQSLAEVDGKSGDVLKNYVYGSDHAPLAQTDLGGTPDFFHSDHLGTTRALTTSSGSASLIQEYGPYGTPSNSALSSLTSQYFTGQYRDGYTGLQYHRARWLDTGQGRWYSQDRIFDWPNNFGNNLSYGGSNPMNGFDASGSMTLGEVLFVSSMIAGMVIGGMYGYKKNGIMGMFTYGIVGGAFGVGVGVLFIAKIIVSLLALAAASILLIASNLLFGGSKKRLPVPPSLPISGTAVGTASGFTTVGGNPGKQSAFLCVANDKPMRPVLERDQFGDIVLTELAGLFNDNGWAVTYGRASSDKDFYSNLQKMNYDVIWILSHGAHSTSGRGSLMQIIGDNRPGSGKAFYLPITEFKSLLYRPKLIFLDGCSLDQGRDSINADCVISSNTDIFGQQTEFAWKFFSLLFEDSKNNKFHTEERFKECFNSTNYKFEGDADISSD